ncbi:MAG TPA: hypothetical protein VFC46_12290 [Humisphaera sp.]|nr:hypothetical protein [Humisphaera sp.]
MSEVNYPHIATFVACLLPFLYALSSAGAPPTTAATRTSDVPADEVIQRLLKEGSLQLSTDKLCTVERFSFRLLLRYTAPNAPDQGMDCIVVRDRARVAILVRTLDQLPYCYMTEGLVVAADMRKPGGLVIYEQGAPEFVWEVNQTGKQDDMHLQQPSDAKLGRIRLDLGGLLRLRAQGATGTAYDPIRGVITVTTDNTENQWLLPAADLRPPLPIAIKDFVTRVPGKVVCGVTVSNETQPQNDFFSVTKEAVTKLGVPVRQLSKDENLVVIPPAKFGDDEQQRKTASLFSILLPDRRKE